MRVPRGSADGGLFGAGRLLGVLTLLIATIGLPISASAQAGYETYVFYLTGHANKNLTELCVGDVVMIDVSAERFLRNRRGSGTDQTTNPAVQVYGVTIDGSV